MEMFNNYRQPDANAFEINGHTSKPKLSASAIQGRRATYMKQMYLSAMALMLFLPSASGELAFRQPEWYLPTNDGCRLFVQEFGRGKETIIVLHGGWGAEHSYLLDAFFRVDRHYHLVFYDQRGSLRSPCPASQISIQKHVEDLEQLRTTLHLDQINIVAHSMGTFLAMDYLEHYPARVKGIVLLGAVPPRTPRTDSERRLWEQQNDAGKSFMIRPEIAAELHRNGLDKDKSSLSPKDETNNWRIRFSGVNLYHIERWRHMKGGRIFYSDEAGEAAAKTMPEAYDFTPALAAHHCPVWFIVGDHDYIDIGAKILTIVSATVPNMRLTSINDAGHSSWIDAPLTFRDSLLKTLGDVTQCR
jgi:proline iminopeptidase